MSRRSYNSAENEGRAKDKFDRCYMQRRAKSRFKVRSPPPRVVYFEKDSHEELRVKLNSALSELDQMTRRLS